MFSVDAPPAFYFMTRHGVVQDFNKMFVLYTGNFHRAFAKGDARIMELVQGGFDRLTPREYRKIERKWLGAPSALAPPALHLPLRPRGGPGDLSDLQQTHPNPQQIQLEPQETTAVGWRALNCSPVT